MMNKFIIKKRLDKSGMSIIKEKYWRMTHSGGMDPKNSSIIVDTVKSSKRLNLLVFI